MENQIKPKKNEENNNDEEVVTSDVTEIYNREWEEDPENQNQAQTEEQVQAQQDQLIDAEDQEPTDQTDVSQDNDLEQDNTNEHPIDSLNNENIYPDIDPTPQTISLPVELSQQQSANNDHSNIHESMQTTNKPSSKLKIIALFVLIFALMVGGVTAFAVIGGKKSSKPPQGTASVTPTPTISPADKAINSFIAAIINKNKINADLMQTVAMQKTVKENGDTTSFYDYCQKSGNFCDQLFSKDYLGSGEIKTLDYTAKDGTKGKQRIYTITKTVSTPSSESSSKSVTIITIATIKVGDIWMIDYFNNESNFGSNTNL